MSNLEHDWSLMFRTLERISFYYEPGSPTNGVAEWARETLNQLKHDGGQDRGETDADILARLEAVL